MEPRALLNEVTGEGEPIVLVPGGLTGWLSWIPHAERLAKTRRVIRVQPIHNELGSAGEVPASAYDGTTERESLLLTLDGLGIARADLAGWSGGARALIEFALTYPERVRTLTLVEPPATWALSAVAGGSEEKERLDAYTARVRGRAVSEDDLAEFLDIAGFVRSGEDPRSLPQWERWLPHRNALAWQDLLGHRSHTADEVGRFDRPVLLVKGSTSGEWPRSIVDVLGKWFPRARVVELDGDHACHIQSIDAFLEELEAHLAAE